MDEAPSTDVQREGARRRTVAALCRTVPFNTATMVFTDVVSATASVAISMWWAGQAQVTAPLWVAALFVPAVIVMLHLRNTYRCALDRRWTDELGPVATTVVLASIVVLIAAMAVRTGGAPEALAPMTCICAAVLMPAARLIHIAVQRRVRRQFDLVCPTLIVGNGLIAHRVAEQLGASTQYGLAPVGILSVDPLWSGSATGHTPSGTPRLGSPDSIEAAIRRTGAEAVIVAFSRMSDELLARVVRTAQSQGLRVWVVPRMFDMIGGRTRVEHLGGLPLMTLPTPSNAQAAAVPH